MRAFFRFLVFAACLTPMSLFAQAEHPTPSSLLGEAKKGRAEMLIALADAERYAPQIGTKEELYGLLSVLDDLDVIRNDLGFDDYGANPVRKSGFAITRQALKWLRFDRDDKAIVDAFLKWSSNETRYTAITGHDFFLSEAETKEEVMHWGLVLKDAILVLKEQKAEAYVMTAYQEFQGAVVTRALRNFKLEDEEFLNLIKASLSVPAMTEIFLTLEQLSYSSSEEGELDGVLTKSLTAAKVVSEFTVPVSLQLQTLPGQVIQETMEKMLFSGAVPPLASLDDCLAAMRPRQFVEMSTWLTQLLLQGVETNQIAYLSQFARKLSGKLQASGQVRQVQDMKRIISQMKVLEITQGDTAVEGTYVGEVGGAPATLTLVNSSPSSLIVGLDIRKSTAVVEQEFSHKFVNYNPDKDEFEALRFGPDEPRSASSVANRASLMRFRLNKGILTGIFYADNRSYAVTMRLRDAYVSYGRRPRLASYQPGMNLSGEYAGSGFRLLLTQNENLCSGTLYSSRQGISVDINFNSGFCDLRNGAIYLTTGEQDNGHWLHLRGQIANGVFEGQYVIGGIGPRLGTIRMRQYQ